MSSDAGSSRGSEVSNTAISRRRGYRNVAAWPPWYLPCAASLFASLNEAP